MTRRPRAAIITPYGLFNYGNRLQNWAVDRILHDQGFDTETLILRKSYFRPVMKDLMLRAGHSLGVKGAASRRYKNFHAFDQAIKKRRVLGLGHLRHLGKKYDLFVIGSDQIWNPHQVDFGGSEYGDFAPGDRVISLSASFGLDQLDVGREAPTRTWLSRLRDISVRESVGAEIVNAVSGREAEVLVDPTLAIPAEVWSERASTRMVPAKPYVLVYLLGTKTKEILAAIDEFATQRGCTVVRVFDSTQPKFYQAGPQDFLALIQGATAFITDSYHGLVFSRLFAVDCYIAERQGKSYSMLSRFDTIAEKLSLQFVADEELPFAKRVNVGEAFEVQLEAERERFASYLRRALPIID